MTTDVEHEGGTNGWFYLKRRAGVEIDLVTIGPTDHDVAGILGRFERTMTSATRVVFVSHVSSSTGLRLPVREISALARRHGIVSIIDGPQAAGAIDVDVQSLGCDAYVGTGQKWIMGQKGPDSLTSTRTRRRRFNRSSGNRARGSFAARPA